MNIYSSKKGKNYMKLTIIILNWNSLEFLKRCIKSINDNLRMLEKEIIVVDNGSNDSSVDFLESNYKEVKLIKNKKNRGVGPARNQGMAIANGEYILNLDVDAEILPNSIDLLVGEMDKREEVGIIAPKLIYPDGETQYSCRKFPTFLSKFIYRQLPKKLRDNLLYDEEMRLYNHEEPNYADYIIGACQLIRKKAMEEVGYYDRHIFYGPEDIDYCLRMWKKGWKVLYYPRAVIIHYEQRITRNNLLNISKPIFWKHIYGLIWYFWKYKYLFNPPKFFMSDAP